MDWSTQERLKNLREFDHIMDFVLSRITCPIRMDELLKTAQYIRLLLMDPSSAILSRIEALEKKVCKCI